MVFMKIPKLLHYMQHIASVSENSRICVGIIIKTNQKN